MAGCDMEQQQDLSPIQQGFMQKFRLYQTQSKFYMIGRDKSRTYWRVLKIDRTEPSELNTREDSTTYTERECSDLLRRIHEGNKSTGGLKFVTTCYGIVGFIKFLGPYYMLLITKRRQIGAICGHTVYAITKSEMIALPNAETRSKMVNYRSENRYRKLLCMVDLTKDFFFSYSYHVMRSLQKNMCNDETGPDLYDTMFVWNGYLTRGIRNLLHNTIWTVAMVYGFFKQDTLSLCGRDFKLTLIARRSRHYAGTRYLKRGVNENGRVANDVETEQILFEDVPEGYPVQISSVVQNRGSIPLFWFQETSRLNLKPDIILSKRDQTYEATRLHFENLAERYGNPIIILDLIKTQEKKPRESILRTEFANAIEFINKDLSEQNRLRFLHWDLNKHSQSKATNVLLSLGKMATYALNLTGFFYCQVTPALRSDGCLKWPTFEYAAASNVDPLRHFDPDIEKQYNNDNGESDNSDGKTSGCNYMSNGYLKPAIFQRGVLRTNCIDCLDRTNVAQYAYGLAALGHQLHALGVTNSTKIDLDDPLAEELMGFYERMGDTLAHQYGGSAAHNKIFSKRRGQWKAAIQSQEFFRTLQRYYSNAYMDAEKQNAINVFLGYFQPREGRPDIWELDSYQHYYVGRNGESYVVENGRSLFQRSFSDGNILHESQFPLSTQSIGQGLSKSNLSNQSKEGSKALSESTPEMSTCESDLTYSRYAQTVPTRQLFVEMQRDRSRALQNADAYDCSNFVDLDWFSSSGNSCEEELLDSESEVRLCIYLPSTQLAEIVRHIALRSFQFPKCSALFHATLRSLFMNSPIGGLSSENVVSDIVGETTPVSSEGGCSMNVGISVASQGTENAGPEASYSDAKSCVVVEELSDSFVRWVNYGETLCH